MASRTDASFYEDFWADEEYTYRYALDSAVRDRYPAIRRVWGSLSPPAQVLDFGCGNGVLTDWMFRNGFGEEVLGVDVSQRAISYAREQFAKPGLSFAAVDDVSELAAHGPFDVVVASHVLEHLDDAANVLGRLAGLAEWIILEVPLEDCLTARTQARVGGRDPRDNPVGHVNFWTRDAFRRLLASQGLLVVHEHHYASAPFSPFTSPPKRLVERALLATLGTPLYGRLLATHYAVLARRPPDAQTGV